MLTSRQQQVLEIIMSSFAERGFPPTLREIAAKLQISGTLGVMKHLDALEKKGMIRKSSGSSRGIALVANPSVDAVAVPIAGTVRAGALTIALEEIHEYFTLDRQLLPGDGAFFLRVKGDSMINAAIVEGDLALIQPQTSAENRDIVVAMVGDEATLKRFYKTRDHIRLQPENPNLAPIIIRPGENEVTIIGKVVGIYRNLS